MKVRNVKRKLFYLGVVGISFALLFFVVTCFWIGRSVKRQCQEAKRVYPGDCVEALITLLNDESRGFRERNSAVWALGQLGDRRALPVLESYYTGNIPPRESLDKTISQYELKKAVKLTSGGFNASAVFWRMGAF